MIVYVCSWLYVLVYMDAVVFVTYMHWFLCRCLPALMYALCMYSFVLVRKFLFVFMCTMNVRFCVTELII